MKLAELKDLLLSDWERYTRLGEKLGGEQMIINALTGKNHAASFLFWWRIASSCRRRTSIRLCRTLHDRQNWPEIWHTNSNRY